MPEIYEAFHKNNINKTENFRDKMTIELYLRTQGFFLIWPHIRPKIQATLPDFRPYPNHKFEFDALW